MAQTRRALTDEQREQRRAEQRELVVASIEQLRTSEGWQAYLNARARFPSYSWRNVLLILSQHPTAEKVAGFRAWLELGYCVTKGSTGIRIWARCAPSAKPMRAWRAAGADPEDKPRATYKLVSVFAQDQVAELPPPATPAPLTAPIAEIRGDSHERLLCAVLSLAQEIGYRVVIGDSGRAEGTCNRQTRQITIPERLAPNGRLAAAIHELAHALVGEDAAAPKLTYAQEELVVESVIFSPCQGRSFESAGLSVGDGVTHAGVCRWRGRGWWGQCVVACAGRAGSGCWMLVWM
jgi:N-terminal domain of anti-restriction factor ArdC